MANKAVGKVPAAAKEESKLPILAGAIGVLIFVLFVAVFSISMGVFSSSNVANKGQKTQQPKEKGEVSKDEESGNFDATYYSDLFTDEESPTDSTENMTEKDSLEHLAWYEKQKHEIESEERKLEMKQRELENLQYKTMKLIEQRKNIEDANTIQMAKLFDSMKTDKIAEIMKNMSNEQVGSILMKMKKQNASKVLAAIPADRAAKITLQMINLAEGD